MVNTKNRPVEAISVIGELHSVGVREAIARQMRASGYGAVLWDERVSGSAGYPTVSADSGREYAVHGLRLNPSGAVCAVVACPAGEEVSGVRSYTPQEADRLISPEAQICAGTPEEWDVLGECFATALHVAGADGQEEQPLPWW